MINILKLIFASIFIYMIYMTTMTSLQLNLFTHLPTLLKDPWAVATLWDAYFGFLTFYVWVYYKENSIVSKLIWFVAIMLLGNIAMALYMLIELFKLKKEDSLETLLLRKK
jgi:hypothetical protein